MPKGINNVAATATTLQADSSPLGKRKVEIKGDFWKLLKRCKVEKCNYMMKKKQNSEKRAGHA